MAVGGWGWWMAVGGERPKSLSRLCQPRGASAPCVAEGDAQNVARGQPLDKRCAIDPGAPSGATEAGGLLILSPLAGLVRQAPDNPGADAPGHVLWVVCDDPRCSRTGSTDIQ